MKHHILSLLAALCCAALLAACGPSNTVILVTPEEISPAHTDKPSIALVAFDDSRSNTALGVRADKSHFYPSGDVQAWFSKTLADDLNKAGMNVTYAPSIAAAVQHNPQYIITGSIDELWLRESSRTNMSAKIRAHFVLTHGNDTIAKEIVSTEREDSNILFNSSSASKLFDDALGDFCNVMTKKIKHAVH